MSQGILDAFAFHSFAGVPAEPWVAAEFRAVNGEIVNESDEAEEHKAYAMEAARRFGPADAGLELEGEFDEEQGEEEFLGP